MNKTLSSSRLTCALTALFILGNSTIFIPAKENSSGALFGLLLCFAVGFLMLVIFKNFDPLTLLSGTAGKIAGVLICLFAFLCAANAATDFSLMANKKILSNENYFLFSIILSSLVFFILKAKKQVIFKLSLIFLVLIIFSQVILFLMSINQFDLSNLKQLSFSGSLFQGSYFFSKCTAPIILLPFLFEKEKSIPKGAVAGMLFGFLLILLPLLQILFIFGFPYTESLDFPFMSVLDTVSIGLKFSRLEGLAYIIFFFGSLIRCSVCLMCAKEILSHTFEKTEKFLPLALSLILFFTSLFSKVIGKFDTPIDQTISLFAIVFMIVAVLLKSRTRFQCKTK